MEPASAPASSYRYVLSAERVFDGARWHEHAAILIEEGRILGTAALGDIPHDWPHRSMQAGTLLVPGFIDLQVNGGGGVLFNDAPTPQSMLAIARAHVRYGTTACLPTLITDTIANAESAIAAAAMTAGKDGIVGLHLEGPFISPSRPGIHPVERIATASMSDLDWLTEAATAGVSLITLAPECVPPGFVRALCRSGIRVAAGHSEASAVIMAKAIDDGLSGVTHLHNAMPPMQARQPGIVGAALSDPRLTAGLIVDGIHVDSAIVRATFAAKGAGGVALVTDAMPTVGIACDSFQLLGKRIELRNGRLTSADGTLAGAHLDMASAVRVAVTRAGIALDDALRAASRTPARYLGLEHERGTFRVGSRADIVAMSTTLHVLQAWVGGEARLAASDAQASTPAGQ
jgi:N-acetylglucosamine-6-phosphate deacetylase